MIVNRLRTRFILAALAVLAVTLGVILLLVGMYLVNRPVAAEPILTRLTTTARSVEQFDGLAALMLGIGAEARTAQTLDRLASRRGVRVLVTDADGVVSYDSQRTVAEGDQLAFSVSEVRPANGNLFYGSFFQESEQWLFIAQVLPVRGGEQIVLFAEPRPSSSWRQVLEIFGRSLVWLLVVAGVVGFVAAAITAYIFSRSITRALHLLRQAAGQVAAGHYSERVPVTGPDEVRDLAAAFNQMAEQVQQTQVSQQDFLANVSHDLRTPLTNIQGFSQAIIDGTSHDPAHHAGIILDEAGRLNRMVGELLDLARISAGRLSMRQSRVNLALLADSITERLAIKAGKAQVQLVRDIHPAPEIAGDGDRLAQVVTNLVDNAIKFTPAGGTVRVAVTPVGGGVQLMVSDTGRGIPPEDLPRIFERFYQVDKARGPRRGTGLGLSITAEIVRAHGGTIRADSGGAGKGTTFTAWFPGLEMTTIIRRM